MECGRFSTVTPLGLLKGPLVTVVQVFSRNLNVRMAVYDGDSHFTLSLISL